MSGQNTTQNDQVVAVCIRSATEWGGSHDSRPQSRPDGRLTVRVCRRLASSVLSNSREMWWESAPEVVMVVVLTVVVLTVVVDTVLEEAGEGEAAVGRVVNQSLLSMAVIPPRRRATCPLGWGCRLRPPAASSPPDT